jgi:hypothetical protein
VTFANSSVYMDNAPFSGRRCRSWASQQGQPHPGEREVADAGAEQLDGAREPGCGGDHDHPDH